MTGQISIIHMYVIYIDNMGKGSQTHKMIGSLGIVTVLVHYITPSNGNEMIKKFGPRTDLSTCNETQYFNPNFNISVSPSQFSIFQRKTLDISQYFCHILLFNKKTHGNTFGPCSSAAVFFIIILATSCLLT